jgi:hypothetical protein
MAYEHPTRRRAFVLLTFCVFLAPALAGCSDLDFRPKKEEAPRTEAAPKKAPTQVVKIPRGEERFLHVLRQEYDDDVIAYEKKYAGKYVEIDLFEPLALRKGRGGYYLPQEYPGGWTDIPLREPDARAFSARVKAAQTAGARVRMLVRTAEEGFGFHDAHFERAGGR